MPRHEPIQVPAGESRLAGTLTLPDPLTGEKGARHPAVLLLPSWLPRDRDGGWDRSGHPAWFAAAPPAATGRRGLLDRLADALAAAGVASLRCDPRGCGGSDGAWGEVDLFTRIDDARDMLACLRRDPRLDLRRTGLVGHGEGATIALAVAGGDPVISALTLVGAPARGFASVLRAGVAARNRTGIDREHPLVAAIDRWSEDLVERAARGERSFRLPLPDGERLAMALAWIEQSVRTPGRALATIVDRSIGLVHGGADAWCDPAESELLAAAIRSTGRGAERRVLPNCGHDLAEAPDQAIGEIAADLAGRLQPRELPPVLVAIEQMGIG